MSDFALMTLDFLIEGVSAAVLFQAFGSPRLAVCRRQRILAGAFWTVFWTAANIVCYFVFDTDDEREPLLKLGVLTVCLFAASLVYFRGTVFGRLFPAVLYTAVRELSLHAAGCFTAFAFIPLNLLVDLAMGEKITLVDYLILARSLSLLITTLSLLLRMGLIYAAVKRIVSYGVGQPRDRREAALLLLPAVTGIMISVLLRLLMLMINDGIPVVIYSRYPALYAIVPVMTLPLLMSIVFSFRFYRDLTELRREQMEKQVLQAQIAGLQRSIAETERLYEDDRRFRHDLKNNLYVLRELLREKCPDDGEIGRYFENLSLSAEEAERRYKTGNAVSDAVVNGKFSLAARGLPGIRLDADGLLLNALGVVEAFDLGIILSNALDNAVEACRLRRQRDSGEALFISVRSRRKKNMLLIEVENSFDGILRLGGDGLPETTKPDGGSHGLGLRSIRSCAEKYAGGMDFSAGNGKFILSVLLQTNVTERREKQWD